MKITYAAAISQDGFIARENGYVSWLEELNIAPEDSGLAEFFASVDGLVMGRKTYDFVFDFGSWPYEDKPSWICTSRPLELLEGANLRVVSKVNDVVSQAEDAGFEHLWLLGGGVLAAAFLEQGLLTNLNVHLMPVTLGTGIPLLARQNWEDLQVAGQQTTQMNGFQQIDIELALDQ